MKIKSLLLTLLVAILMLSLAACSFGLGGTQDGSGDEDDGIGGDKDRTAKLEYYENETGWTASQEWTNGKTTYFSDEIRIPSTYEGKPVTAVSGGFYSNPDSPVAEIHIPSSVKSMEGFYLNGDIPAKLYYEGTLSDWCGMTFYRLDDKGDYSSMMSLENISEFYAGQTLVFGVNGFADDVFANIESISGYAFSNAVRNSSLNSSLTFTNTKTIGPGAFYCANGISELTLGGKLESVGDNAFYRTSVKAQTLTFTKDDIFIGKNAFDMNGIVGTYLLTYTESTVPDGVTSIASGAFANTELYQISLPYSIKAISKDAFTTKYRTESDDNYVTVDFRGANKYWFNIKTNGDFFGEYGKVNLSSAITDGNKILWPEGATTIPPRTFQNNTTFKILEIPEGIVSIGVSAFAGCSTITKVQLPASLEYIGEKAFNNSFEALYATSLNDLLKIQFDCDVTAYANDGCYFNGERLSGKVVLPEITTLASGVFKKSEVTEIVFPDSLLEIPSGCVANNQTLTKITLGKNTVKIGKDAFYGCKGVTSVTIPATVTEIGGRAFESTSLSTITLHEGIQLIGEDAFASTNIYEIVVPTTVTRFYYPGGKSLKIYADVNIEPISSAGVKNIEKLYIDIGNAAIMANAFSGCTNLKEVEIASASLVSSYAFSWCVSLTSVTLPENLKEIGSYAFEHCSMKEIVIPDKVSSVGILAFSNNDDLLFITLGKSLVNLGGDNYSAFSGCDRILEIYDKTSSNLGTHMAAYNEGILNVYKEGEESAVYTESGFKFVIGANSAVLFEYVGNGSVLNLPASVKGKSYSIQKGTFKGITTFNKVVIPSTIEEIQAEAFKDTALSEVVISDGVKIIGDYAFESIAITSINIPASVTKIGAGAFKGNANLTTVTFADNSNLDEIGEYAFAYTAITEITLPTVSKTGRYCFAGCKELKYLSLGTMRFDGNNTHGLTRILGYLFECNATEEDGFVVVSQGYEAPNGWYTLNFKIPEALKTVEVRGSVYESGFDNCTMIEKLILRGKNSIHEYGLVGCSNDMTVYFEGDAELWSSLYRGDFDGTVVFIEEGEEIIE